MDLDMDYKLALTISYNAHKGQEDKCGVPYFLHPYHVSLNCETEEQQIVALLHDVVEDSDVEIEDIAISFGHKIAHSIDCITHRYGETYNDYLARVMSDEVARYVKIKDIEHNLLPERLSDLDAETQSRLMKKYGIAKVYLTSKQNGYNI